MADLTEVLDCTPQGDYVTEKRVKKFSDQLSKGEKAHYVLALNWLKIGKDKKNPARQSLVLITDKNIYILIRKVAGKNERRNISLDQVKGVKLNTGITAKKLVFKTQSEDITFKVTNPGKAECKDVAKFVRNVREGLDKSSDIKNVDEEDYIMKAKGANGQLILHQDKVVITREGFTGKIVHGFKGKKEIPIDQITGIQFKEPSKLTAGYIQIGQSGYSESKGGLQDAAKDENTVTFKKNSHKFKQSKEKISELRNRDEPSSQSKSAVDRLKERYVEGEISEEEYKKKLEVLENGS